MKPKLFVGSSTEGLEVARAIAVQLEHDAEVTVWNEGIFGLGQGTLESLVKALDEFDYAVLVLTPDDMLVSRETATQSPRDNVLLELGLFIGRLGRERTFIVFNRDKDLKLPTDLAGVSMADYGNREDNNLVAALGPGCTKIRYAIQSHGTYSPKAEASYSIKYKNQPIIIAKVTTHAEGNLAATLNLTVHNTGYSPAKNIRLKVRESEIEKALASDNMAEHIRKCFSERGMIPILENGHQVTNSFGIITRNSKDSTW